MTTNQTMAALAVVAALTGIGIVSVRTTATDAPKARQASTASDVVMEKKEDQAMMGQMQEPVVMEKKDEAAMMAPKDGSAMMEKKDGSAMTEKPAMQTGAYLPYDASLVAMASEQKDVVLFFRASWCPSCRAIDADIRAHATEIPSSLTILDVDYDASSELKKKYGVTYQHTFVQVDAKGAAIKKWSGSPTLASLVAETR